MRYCDFRYEDRNENGARQELHQRLLPLSSSSYGYMCTHYGVMNNNIHGAVLCAPLIGFYYDYC